MMTAMAVLLLGRKTQMGLSGLWKDFKSSDKNKTMSSNIWNTDCRTMNLKSTDCPRCQCKNFFISDSDFFINGQMYHQETMGRVKCFYDM